MGGSVLEDAQKNFFMDEILVPLEERSVKTRILIESPLSWGIHSSDTEGVQRYVQAYSEQPDVDHYFPKGIRDGAHVKFSGENWGGGWIFKFAPEFFERSFRSIHMESTDPRLPLILMGAKSESLHTMGWTFVGNLLEISKNTLAARIKGMPSTKDIPTPIIGEILQLDGKLESDLKELGIYLAKHLLSHSLRSFLQNERFLSTAVDREILWAIATGENQTLDIVVAGGFHSLQTSIVLMRAGYKCVYGSNGKADFWPVTWEVSQDMHDTMNAHLKNLLEVHTL